MPSDNAELVRGAYEAFGRGDVPAVMALLAEDVDWNAPDVLPHGAQGRGHEVVGGFFQTLAETWEGFDLELEDFVASGDRVCAIGRASGRLDGVQAGYGFVHCWTVRDGKLAALNEYVDPDAEVVARARSAAS
ncbi:MAG TPA: nuclear transport factor 2 family protein [Thermoleophilaceae bacterium]|jgi:hypothetical protein